MDNILYRCCSCFWSEHSDPVQLFYLRVHSNSPHWTSYPGQREVLGPFIYIMSLTPTPTGRGNNYITCKHICFAHTERHKVMTYWTNRFRCVRQNEASATDGQHTLRLFYLTNVFSGNGTTNKIMQLDNARVSAAIGQHKHKSDNKQQWHIVCLTSLTKVGL